MDIATLKSDFYKRFDTSDNMLITEKCGMLCTLLGFCHIRGAMALSTSLSMGVTGVCRRLGGDLIKITNTRSPAFLTYYAHEFPFGKKPCGAQLLLDNAIPGYIESATETKVCALKCIMRLNAPEGFDKISAAAMCCGRDNIKPYLALLEAIRGYAVVSHKLTCSLVPLPLTGFKFILIQFETKKKTEDFSAVEQALNILSARFPYVSTFADLNDEVLRFGAPLIKNRRTIARLGYLVNETKRISCAVTALRAMHTEDLFDIINESAAEYEQLWGVSEGIRTLLAFARICDGVRASRPLANGIICIADEDMSDHITRSFCEQLKYRFDSSIRFCISN